MASKSLVVVSPLSSMILPLWTNFMVKVRLRCLTSRACTKLCVLLPSMRMTTGWLAMRPNRRSVSE